MCVVNSVEFIYAFTYFFFYILMLGLFFYNIVNENNSKGMETLKRLMVFY